MHLGMHPRTPPSAFPRPKARRIRANLIPRTKRPHASHDSFACGLFGRSLRKINARAETRPKPSARVAAPLRLVELGEREKSVPPLSGGRLRLLGEVAEQFLARVNRGVAVAVWCEPCVVGAGGCPTLFFKSLSDCSFFTFTLTGKCFGTRSSTSRSSFAGVCAAPDMIPKAAASKDMNAKRMIRLR